MLLAGSQAHSVDFEGSRLPPMEEFVRSISTKAHEWMYKESTAKRREQVNTTRLEKENAEKQAAEKAKNDYLANETESQKAYRIDLINHLKKNYPDFNKYPEIRQVKTVDDFNENRSKQLAYIQEKQLSERTIATREYVNTKNEYQKALEANGYTYNKVSNLDEKRNAASSKVQNLLDHVGTFVDPNFKPYEMTERTTKKLSKIKNNYMADKIIPEEMDFMQKTYDKIYQDIEDNIINYQARLNQLHEQDFNTKAKLTFSEKFTLLKKIIPSIEFLNFQQQDFLVNKLTGTINR